MRRRPIITEYSAPLASGPRCTGRTEEPRSPPQLPSGPLHPVRVLVEIDAELRASRVRQAAIEALVARALPLCDRAALGILAFGLLLIARQILPALLP